MDPYVFELLSQYFDVIHRSFCAVPLQVDHTYIFGIAMELTSGDTREPVEWIGGGNKEMHIKTHNRAKTSTSTSQQCICHQHSNISTLAPQCYINLIKNTEKNSTIVKYCYYLQFFKM